MDQKGNLKSKEKIQELLKILQSKSYLNSEQMGLNLCEILRVFEAFDSFTEDSQLVHYINPYLIQLAQSLQILALKRGQILQYHGKAYNDLYLLGEGELLLFQPKDQADMEKEMYWVQAEQQSFIRQQERKQEQEQQRQQQILSIQQQQSGFQRKRFYQSQSQQQQQQFQFQQVEEKKKQEGEIQDVYKMINGDAQSNKKSTEMRILENIRFKDTNVLKISNQYLNQYFSGSLCLFKFVQKVNTYQNYGLIVEKGNRVSQFTCVASENSIVFKVSGSAYHKIFSELKDKFFFCFPFYQKILTNSIHSLVIKEISLLSKRKILPIGKTLFVQGDPAEHMFLVKEGSIAYRVGNQKILSMTAGDYFGIEDLFLKKRFFSAFCESQNTVIYEVSREHFKSKQLLKQMQKLSLQKLRFLAHKLELQDAVLEDQALLENILAQNSHHQYSFSQNINKKENSPLKNQTNSIILANKPSASNSLFQQNALQKSMATQSLSNLHNSSIYFNKSTMNSPQNFNNKFTRPFTGNTRRRENKNSFSQQMKQYLPQNKINCLENDNTVQNEISAQNENQNSTYLIEQQQEAEKSKENRQKSLKTSYEQQIFKKEKFELFKVNKIYKIGNTKMHLQLEEFRKPDKQQIIQKIEEKEIKKYSLPNSPRALNYQKGLKQLFNKYKDQIHSKIFKESEYSSIQNIENKQHNSHSEHPYVPSKQFSQIQPTIQLSQITENNFNFKKNDTLNTQMSNLYEFIQQEISPDKFQNKIIRKMSHK